MIRRLRREESGFTLVELLVATSIGTIIVLAGLLALDLGVKQTAKITQREDSVQRARVAMFNIARQLRSQTCPDSNTPAIADGQPYSVRFYTSSVTLNSLTGAPGTATVAQHQISWDTNTGRLIESDWSGGTGPPSTPTSTRVLAENVQPPPGTNAPIFSYYTFQQAADGSVTASTPLTAPLAAADLSRVVRMTIAFTVKPTDAGAASGGSTTLQQDVVSRATDTDGSGSGPVGPTCS